MTEVCQSPGPISVVPRMDKRYRRISDLYHCLGDTSRIKILLTFIDGPQTVGEICKQLGFGQATVSHHVSLMRAHRIVEGTRKGRQIFYQLTELGQKLVNPVPDLLNSDLVT